ncbi:hypothetical protein [Spirosoma sp.]|uniref:hypothetical protein n=1 Tax=Spirosoma sp. TaxID=1899569 RepID=UPI0026204C3A|nr:hypothetical protein [Spirosoma sp.]MCX6218561.1 hypothetical protein [Spirosoma sp.]
MRTIFLFWSGLLATTLAIAQPVQVTHSVSQFAVNLTYNSEQSRYEVYARPNFKSNRFNLGPSQVSIVVPKSIADQPLAIYSETARWSDYSTVFAPAAAPEEDFHGIHSMGKLIDFEENTPFLLFTFSLQGGYTEGVRLFVNGQDPTSDKMGMKGGDFGNIIQDFTGKDYFMGAFDKASLNQLASAPTELKDPTVLVYPNPIAGDAFTVTAQQYNPGERVRLRLLSASGVEFRSMEEDVTKLISYRMPVPSQAGGLFYLSVERISEMKDMAGPKKLYKKLVISK